jgi:hypothetical protein
MYKLPVVKRETRNSMLASLNDVDDAEAYFLEMLKRVSQDNPEVYEFFDKCAASTVEEHGEEITMKLLGMLLGTYQLLLSQGEADEMNRDWFGENNVK